MNAVTTRTITFRISRERPGRLLDRPARTEFAVPVEMHTTVVDALEYIRTHLDQTLMYRHSCHHGSCGTCGMIINGKRLLACTTNVLALGTDVVDVRPLVTMRHLGDLAVDPTPLFVDFPARADYRRASDVHPKAERPAEIKDFERFEDCIECGLCVSACPVTARFMGPAALAAVNRELEKHPERRAELLSQVNVPHGVWACDRALECSRTCPTGVYPAKHIALLQRAIKQNG